MTKPRILHFLWNGEVGGLARAVYQLVRYEVVRDEAVVAVAFGQREGLYAEAISSLGCQVVDLRMRSGSDLPRALQAVGQLREFDIHHFHVMEPSEIFASTRCEGVTRVYTERGGFDNAGVPLRKKARRAMGGMLIRKHFHAVSGNTSYAALVAVERYGLQRLPREVTYNGIDFGLLAPQLGRSDIRRQLGIDSTALVVGSSGTFKSWKRFDYVVGLLATRPDLHVVLVGGGDLRATFERQAHLLHAEDRLHITGLVDSVADYLAAADIFVLASSTTESFGNSVVEAMALGIPSIVFSDSPGICEHVKTGTTGYVVSDREELASVVAYLADNTAVRSSVGQAGATHVRSKYTLEHMHDAYHRLYTMALENRAIDRRLEA
ncbi:MAG: glycosyltransferase [Armatimonadetes bacterium]|nr:glycosyltransferase [Armatimonadota bacterium]